MNPRLDSDGAGADLDASRREQAAREAMDLVTRIAETDRDRGERERKGAGVPWYLGASAGPGGFYAGGSGAASPLARLLLAGRSFGRALLGAAASWLRSPAVIGLAATGLTLTAAIAIKADSIGSWWGDQVTRPKFMAMPQYSRSVELKRASDDAARSLELLAQANPNGLGEGAPPAAASGAGESSSKSSDDDDDAPAGQPPGGAGIPDAQAFMNQLNGSGSGRDAEGRDVRRMPTGSPGLSLMPGQGASGGALQALTGGSSSSRGGGRGKVVASAAKRSFNLGAGGRGTFPKNSRALSQLRFADKNSRNAAGTTGDGSRYAAQQAFEGGAVRGGGSPIDGGGLSNGGAGVSQGSPDSPVSSGGPMSANPARQDIQQNCEHNPNLAGCKPADEDSEDVTPWNYLTRLGATLLLAAMVLLSLAYILRAAGWGEPWGRYVAFVAGSLGVLAAVAGAALMATHGQYLLGSIFIVGGSLMAYLGFTYDAKGGEAGNLLHRQTDPKVIQVHNNLGAGETSHILYP